MFGFNNKLDPEWLRSVAFFDGLDDDALGQIAGLGQRRDVGVGTELIDQGRIGDSCYVVVEGRAVISQGGDFLAAVGPGTMVGEMALVGSRPRTATVTAETDMVLVEFGAKEFRKLLERIPEARTRVLDLLDARQAENQRRDS